MQSTTNYSMNLVEGTDIVNIPVQLNPNFQTIDGAMFDNKQASVGTATEVVTGTAHAIVRNNPDSDVFRFTATGAWTAGDTMSVDGNSVTVHLSDGTVPPTGAYIIGAEVLAVINSSLVTLMIGMTPPAQGVTSFNSRTGTVVPTAGDYVAGDIDYDNTGSGLTATDVQNAIDEIVSIIPSGGNDFSTTEHVYGKWIDNTTIYEKTINFGALPANTSKTVAHGISNFGMLIDMVFVARVPGSYNIVMPLPAAEIYCNSTDVGVSATLDYSAYSESYVTMRYTKSV